MTNGVTSTYQYDHDGRRTQQTVNGQATNYLWDITSPYGDVIAEYSSTNTLQASYTLANGQLLSQSRANDTSYYLADGQHSIRALMDENGAITDTYDYTAFGEIYSQTGSTPNNYLYTGQQYDSTTDLYSLRARYYAPSEARFLSRDSYTYNYQNPIELNRYGYATNNPVTYYDPTGYFAFASYALTNAATSGTAGAFAGGIAGFVTSGMILVLAALDICGSLGKWVYGLSDRERSDFIATSTAQGTIVGGLSGAAIGFAGSFGPAAGLSVSASIATLGLAGALKQLANIPDPAGRACAFGAMFAGAAAGTAGTRWFNGTFPQGGFWTGGANPGNGLLSPAVGPSIGGASVFPTVNVPPWTGVVSGIAGASTTGTGGSSGDNGDDDDYDDTSPEKYPELYRGDSRKPSEIKEAGGFHPRKQGATGSPEELVAHASDGRSPHYGKYVSTSADAEAATELYIPSEINKVNYVYKIRNPGGGFDMRKAFLKILGYIPRNNQEAEIAFGKPITLEYIEAVRTVDYRGNVSEWRTINWDNPSTWQNY